MSTSQPAAAVDPAPHGTSMIVEPRAYGLALGARAGEAETPFNHVYEGRP